MDLAIEIFKHRKALNFGVIISRAIGGAIGLVAGFYLGYQFSILVGVGSVESSAIAVGICFGFGIANNKIGSFFGNVLLPT